MRVPSSVLLLVLVALGGLLGPPAASASDRQLRGVVARDVAADKRLGTAAERLGKPSSKSFASYVRFVRRVANYYARVERSSDGLRRRYLAARPQTPQARRGRLLALRGHRAYAAAAGAGRSALRRGADEMVAAPSERTYRQALRRMVRSLDAADARSRRPFSRIVRGRRLIRTAPTPPAPSPTPNPDTPAPSTPPASPAPADPPASTPAPLLPGLPAIRL